MFKIPMCLRVPCILFAACTLSQWPRCFSGTCQPFTSSASSPLMAFAAETKPGKASECFLDL